VTQRINEETAKWEAVVIALGIKDKF
jgi:hypothetical protein